MLEIKIKPQEFLNELTSEIVKIPGATLRLEHSLISIKKWESKWHKPFLEKNEKTNEEILDYVRCMSLDSNINPIIYQYLPGYALDEILKYIQDPMTATWFSNNNAVGAAKSRNEVITNEIIYYWMIKFNIPVEFQKWHIEQLLTLIKVISLKDSPPKKMSQKEAAAQQRALNAQRRSKMHSKG